MEDSDKNTENLSVEQSMDLDSFWAKYRGVVVSICVVVVAIAIIWGGLTYAADAAQKQVQKEYLRLNDKASKIAFAKRQALHPLGGLVMLDLAYEYYSEGNFQAAADTYKQAQESGLHKESALLEQALLGEIFSIVKLDKTEGLKRLEAVAKNTELLDATRGYAIYELAGLAIAQKSWQKAKDYIMLLNNLTYAKSWKRQAAVFADIYPQLAL